MTNKETYQEIADVLGSLKFWRKELDDIFASAPKSTANQRDSRQMQQIAIKYIDLSIAELEDASRLIR